MIDLKKIEYVYMVGIGGIGMSAIARYFKSLDIFIAGYDKTPTNLTNALISEGIPVHFEDDIMQIPKIIFEQKHRSVIIYTPAIPSSHSELNYFKSNNFNILKRSEMLSMITGTMKTIAVAGSHGKTTVSSIIAHIFRESGLDCNAFLGGISKNYNSNLLVSPKSNFAIAEADEFDRSFLKLNPLAAIITSIDADHLDIYKDKKELVKSFALFAELIKPGGILILKNTLKDIIKTKAETKLLTYSLDTFADFYAENISQESGFYTFDLVTPKEKIREIKLGVPGIINVENAVAASAMAWYFKIGEDEIRRALLSYSGIIRRFDYQVNTTGLVFIDDYAHHPEEIRAFLDSVKKIYPDKAITGIFQPHLFSRTKDFADEFADSLAMLDRLILLDIYPARELPMKGVTSKLIFDKVRIKNKILCSKQDMLEIVSKNQIEVLVTLGAGDIDTLVEPIKIILLNKK